ncbi:hypothetical protein BC937DRAFT_86122 [Endogone sp. FLAS-F59071]|nr:hypothetical protein BC937DRAFT_86122 [Endogone sp. FLAS-F59071]|eukprot:RUS23437.1 hypothetical protein BC937DRAFT_86122 [Endogone sp. FLAS-F59071]
MNRTSNTSNGAGGIVLQPHQHFSINQLIHQYQQFSLSAPQGDQVPPTPLAEDSSLISGSSHTRAADPAHSQPNQSITTEAVARSESWGAAHFGDGQGAPTLGQFDHLSASSRNIALEDNNSKSLTTQETLYLQQRQSLLLQQQHLVAVAALDDSNQQGNCDPAVASTSNAFPISSSISTLDDGIYFSSTVPLVPAEPEDDEMLTEDPDGYSEELSFLMNDLVMGEADARKSAGSGHMPYCM